MKSSSKVIDSIALNQQRLENEQMQREYVTNFPEQQVALGCNSDKLQGVAVGLFSA